MNESQELSKELILKNIYVSSIDDDCTLWGGLTAIFDSNTYHVEFIFDMEYGAELAIVTLEGLGEAKDQYQYCGVEIPVEPYARILDAYITDYINSFFTQSSNEIHIFITEDDLSKSNR